MGISEFAELKISFELDPFLSVNMHKTSEMLNFHFEVMKISQGKKLTLKTLAGAATGAVYVLSFNTLRALVIIKFRAKREKIFRKVLPFS